MDQVKELSHEELLEVYSKIDEIITYLEKEKQSMEDKDGEWFKGWVCFFSRSIGNNA